ncbi:hypothetical protein KL86PLE_130573 [uncultured Pleomorphomonas sp.]|uniref:Uncharacterized protein n=1 Tax=uncultured Pleomorphomonas sp. TaxID=442121 RepID=A0A212LC83_9HYPH|nr:hypothetical protein KL86PLE_130573 [uncultured Pleomorphomonas sp.]
MIRIIEGSIRAGAEGSVFAIVKILTMCIISEMRFWKRPPLRETAATKPDEGLTARQRPAETFTAPDG